MPNIIYRVMFFLFLTSLNAFALDEKTILGGIEKVILIEKNMELNAKLDTGATTSSVSAKNIKVFKYNNTDWVRFTVYAPLTQNEFTFTKPLLGFSHILKRQDEKSTSHKEFSNRPIVDFWICIGNQKQNIPVNLIDRTYFRYPMLLGRDAIKQLNVLVDVNQKYSSKPNCS